MGVIFWTSGCKLTFQSAGGKDKAAICTIKCEPKAEGGIVVAQVNEVVDKLPRVDIPGDRVDFVVVAPKPFYIEPLFTRDPASITEIQILAAMMAIKGIYAEYGIKRLNHGIGFNTAAIELLLPTYADKLGLKGKIATHWALNPHPTLNSRDRVGVGQTDPQLRLGGGHGCLHARPV